MNCKLYEFAMNKIDKYCTTKIILQINEKNNALKDIIISFKQQILFVIDTNNKL